MSCSRPISELPQLDLEIRSVKHQIEGFEVEKARWELRLKELVKERALLVQEKPKRAKNIIEPEEVYKPRVFMEIFKALGRYPDDLDVSESALLSRVASNKTFSDMDDAKKYFHKAIREGWIYERRPKYWALA